jgi:hypothetical protein
MRKGNAQYYETEVIDNRIVYGAMAIARHRDECQHSTPLAARATAST